MAESAAALKDEGNKQFMEGDYLKAAATYTKAIKVDPDNAVLYSNRSACLLKLKKVTKALQDAEDCIRLRPEWEKGYFRKGAVYEELEQFAEALEVYQVAVKLNPDSKELGLKVRSLQKLVQAKAGAAGGSSTAAPAAARAVIGVSRGSSAAASGFKFPASAPAPAGQAKQQQQQQQQLEKQQQPEKQQKGAGGTGGATGEPGVVYEDLGSEEVAQFAKEYLEDIALEIRDNGTAWPSPRVHILPGAKPSSYEDHEQHIRGTGAFESPTTLQGFVDFVRTTAAKLEAKAVFAAVPTDLVAYPQVWVKPGWPAGPPPGVFVHLDSPTMRKLWFVPVVAGSKQPGDSTSLSPADWGVLPPLVR